MAEGSLELFQKGCLGTCWYGKYHYLEPWAGCGHGCQYCYARLRSPVVARLAELKTSYEEPAPLYPPEELLRRIAEGVKSLDVRAAKLCRYTDIFSPGFVADGLACEVLKTLAASPVERIIVTTKGLPDQRLLALMRKHKAKFSYNAAARPAACALLEPGLADRRLRLEAAASLKRDGVLTTIHLDPLLAGVDDEPAVLRPFLEGLRGLGLTRVMFSYLLLNPEIQARLQARLPPDLCARLFSAYDLGRDQRFLPGQEETDYAALRSEVKRESVERVAGAMKELGFEFVLCSLKSTPGAERGEYRDAKPCDGTFYA